MCNDRYSCFKATFADFLKMADNSLGIFRLLIKGRVFIKEMLINSDNIVSLLGDPSTIITSLAELTTPIYCQYFIVVVSL